MPKTPAELARYYQQQAQALRAEAASLRESENTQGDARAKEENARGFEEAAQTINTRLFEEFLRKNGGSQG